MTSKIVIINSVLICLFITFSILLLFFVFSWTNIDKTNERMVKTNCTIVDYPVQLNCSTSYINISYHNNGRIFTSSIIIKSDNYIKLVQLYNNNITIDCYYDMINPTIVYLSLLNSHGYFIAFIFCWFMMIFIVGVFILFQLISRKNNKEDAINETNLTSATDKAADKDGYSIFD